jgi:hypothetical protein
MPNVVSKEWQRASRIKYDQFYLERAARIIRSGTVDHSMTRDINIALTAPAKSAHYDFKDGQLQKPKWDWTLPQNKVRLESAVIALKALERRISSIEDIADFQKRGGQMPSSNKGPTAARYNKEPNQNGATESASHQASIGLMPDKSAGSARKKTPENPMGTGDAGCACGQPRAKCSCATGDKRIARSTVMDIKPSLSVLPFAVINKNLRAAETSAFAAMKKQMATRKF